MRIALDATPLTISSGGLPRYVGELAVALAREFPGRHVLPAFRPAVPDAGVGAGQSAAGPAAAHRGGEAMVAVRSSRAHRARAGAQIFHGTNFEVPYVGSTPAILTIHDLSPWRDRAWHASSPNADADRVRMRTPWLVRLKRARMILTVSEAVRQEVISAFRRAGGPCARGAAGGFERISVRYRLTPRAQKPFFLFVARWSRARMWPLWSKAGAQRARRREADLVIAGRNRADFAEPFPPTEGTAIAGRSL